MLCNECTKRELCTSLCPEAELYANQDEVPQRELTIGLPKYAKNAESMRQPAYKKIIAKFMAKPRKEQVLTLVNAGMSREDICEVLDISKENLRWILHELKKA